MRLKPIAKDSIPRALERAQRYRLLNEPLEAESICLDILAIEPEHQTALVYLLLALTDQFESGAKGVAEARELLPRLQADYERAYYAGIICERHAKRELLLDHAGASYHAFEHLAEAMAYYEKAEALAPDGNDEAILRYNACVRMIARDKLSAPGRFDSETPLE